MLMEGSSRDENSENLTNQEPLQEIVIKEEEIFFPKPKTLFSRLFGPMSAGSLRGSIFNISILSLGAGTLSLPQKIHYLTLIGAPFIIILAGLVNCWTLLLLSSMANQYKITSYSKLASYLHGKWLSKVLDITIICHILGVIILYQVIIYKLVGGIINEFGNYGYENLDDFLLNSFWKDYAYKFPVNYGLALLVLLPLCLLKDISKMRFSSTLGISSFFFLTLIIIIQSPMYIAYFFENTYKKDDPKFQYNYFDFSVGFNKDMNFFKSVATLFYSYSCHVGAFPVLRSLNNGTQKRVDKVFKRAIMLDAFCYLMIGIVGYLSMPINTPDLIMERKSIFNSDWIMTIGRISFIFTLLMKIPVNYNAFRVASLEVLNKDSSEITNTYNFSITLPTLLFTTLVASLYQSITDYITLLGSFCAVTISFFVPGMIYIKGNHYPVFHWKNMLTMILTAILVATGFVSGFYTILGIIDKSKK